MLSFLDALIDYKLWSSYESGTFSPSYVYKLLTDSMYNVIVKTTVNGYVTLKPLNCKTTLNTLLNSFSFFFLFWDSEKFKRMILIDNLWDILHVNIFL